MMKDAIFCDSKNRIIYKIRVFMELLTRSHCEANCGFAEAI